MGASGSACEYADVRIQINAFTPARLEELRTQNGKEWTPVSGVGAGAYFHATRLYAQLYVRVGTNTLTIQRGGPFGVAADIRPNTIELPNALVPRLR